MAPAPGIDGGFSLRSETVKSTVVTLDVPDIDATLAGVVAHGGLEAVSDLLQRGHSISSPIDLRAALAPGEAQ